MQRQLLKNVETEIIMIPKTQDLLDLSHTKASSLLCRFEYAWQALPHIKEFIFELGKSLSPSEYEQIEHGIWIAKSARVAKSAHIGAPCIIGENAEIRHCAYIRGAALIGDGAVIGNSTELKNCIIFDGAQVPHYNYVGDSILGYRAHMGAGAVTSNVKSDKSAVCVRSGGESINTNMKKFGAILGDFAEIGCGAVLNPGTLIGQRSSVYPQVSVRGVIPPDSIVKSDKNIVKRTERKEL